MAAKSGVIIYHKGCSDGFVAAWAVARSDLVDRPAELIPAQYGDTPPEVAGRDVVIVDFSYPVDVMVRLAEQAGSLVWADHHKTAGPVVEALKAFPMARAVFDLERSGAGLAWDTFRRGPRPWLIDYVEDRDLWRWKLPDSRAVSDFISVHPHELDVFDRLAAMPVEEAVKAGQAIRLKVDAYCRAVAANVRFTTWGPEALRVAVVNAPGPMISDLLHHVLEERTEADIALGWFVREDGVVQFSFRSRKGGPDVAEFAKTLGGGGHANAAGASVTLETLRREFHL